MPDAWRLEIKSQVECLTQVVTWIEKFCAIHASAKPFEHRLQITAEELIINVITHGNVVTQQDCRIWLTLYPQPEGVAMAIEDDAPPFNPFTESPVPNTDVDIDDRPIGGLGIKIVTEMADGVAYSHVQRNRIVLGFGPGSVPEKPDAGRMKHKKSAPNLLTKDTNGKKLDDVEVAPRWHPGRMTMQVIAVLLLLLAAGVTAAGTLNVLKFKHVLKTTIASRYDPILRELVRSIGDSLKEDLSLAAIQTTEQMIERSVAQFNRAFDLTVEDLDGEMLFSTKSQNIDIDGVNPPLPALRPGKIRHVFVSESQVIAQLAILQNEEPIGILSLSHDSMETMGALPDITRSIIHAGVISFLAVFPFLILTALIVFGKIEGRFYHRKRAIDLAKIPAGACPSGSDPLVQSVWSVGQLRRQAAPSHITADRRG